MIASTIGSRAVVTFVNASTSAEISAAVSPARSPNSSSAGTSRDMISWAIGVRIGRTAPNAASMGRSAFVTSALNTGASTCAAARSSVPRAVISAVICGWAVESAVANGVRRAPRAGAVATASWPSRTIPCVRIWNIGVISAATWVAICGRSWKNAVRLFCTGTLFSAAVTPSIIVAAAVVEAVANAEITVPICVSWRRNRPIAPITTAVPAFATLKNDVSFACHSSVASAAFTDARPAARLWIVAPPARSAAAAIELKMPTVELSTKPRACAAETPCATHASKDPSDVMRAVHASNFTMRSENH